MSGETKYKDPDSVLDYSTDWSDWLSASGDDTINSSIWIVPDGITKDSDTFTDTDATIWLSGGTDGEKYNILNRITTIGNRTDDWTFTLKIKEK